MKGRLFQCGGFLDMQIEMEPLVIDWAKEEPKGGFPLIAEITRRQFFR